MKKGTTKKNRQRDHIVKHKLIRIGTQKKIEIYEIVKSNKMVNNNLIYQL